MTDDTHPEFLAAEEALMWEHADGLTRSLLRRISIARRETDTGRKLVAELCVQLDLMSPNETTEKLQKKAADWLKLIT